MYILTPNPNCNRGWRCGAGGRQRLTGIQTRNYASECATSQATRFFFSSLLLSSIERSDKIYELYTRVYEP